MKKLIPVVFAMGLVLLCGCSGATIYSDYREVADIEIIRTIGIDRAGDEIIIAASTGAESDTEKPKIFRATGSSVSDALRDIQTTPIGHNLYFAHAEHILIGEEAARAGIEPYLDFVERASEMRLDTNIYIVRDGTAEELLKGCSGEGSSATDMLSFLERNVKNLGQGYVYTCEDVAASLASEGNALIMAVRSEKTNFITAENEDGKILLAAGFAVMTDGKLADYLTEDETRGAALLTEKITFDNAPLKTGNGTVSLGINGVKVRVTPVFRRGELAELTVDIQLEANVEEIDGGADVSNRTVRDGLADTLASHEAEKAEAAVRRAQEMKTDFIGLGGEASRARPTEFRNMEENWEARFPELPININISAVIRRSYDIDDPLSVSGKEGEGFWFPTTE